MRHSAGVVVQITQNELAQFALGQVLALGIAAFLLAVVIMTIGLPAHAAQQATSAAPTAPEPVPMTDGLTTILARPDSTEAGLQAELIRKRFELIKQVVPGVARVAVLWQHGADREGAMAALQQAGKAASATGVSLQFFPAVDSSQLDEALSDISTGQVNAILVMPSPMLAIDHKYIVQTIAKTRLAAIYDARVFVEDGGLMSYGLYLKDPRAHRLSPMERILDKTSPTDLQVEQSTKAEFVVNLKTAKALGIEIPASLLSRVDEVIE